jgi:hypothetical protein
MSVQLPPPATIYIVVDGHTERLVVFHGTAHEGCWIVRDILNGELKEVLPEQCRPWFTDLKPYEE